MKNDLEDEVNEKKVKKIIIPPVHHGIEPTTYSIMFERLTTELYGQLLGAV